MSITTFREEILGIRTIIAEIWGENKDISDIQENIIPVIKESVSSEKRATKTRSIGEERSREKLWSNCVQQCSPYEKFYWMCWKWKCRISSFKLLTDYQAANKEKNHHPPGKPNWPRWATSAWYKCEHFPDRPLEISDLSLKLLQLYMNVLLFQKMKGKKMKLIYTNEIPFVSLSTWSLI